MDAKTIVLKGENFTFKKLNLRIELMAKKLIADSGLAELESVLGDQEKEKSADAAWKQLCDLLFDKHPEGNLFEDFVSTEILPVVDGFFTMLSEAKK
jgi:hypothetical protein